MATPSSQAEASARMYSARAEKYENSWHPEYSARFVQVANIQPGERVLDLCCGTGLDAFLVAHTLSKSGKATNPAEESGIVVGVDTTAAMLTVAKRRQQEEPEAVRKRLIWLEHDVTHLETLASTVVTEGSFDTILCSNAFVLFDNPDIVVASWRLFLKPPQYSADNSNRGGGILVIDIPHPHNQRAGLTMERTAHRLGLPWPSNRSWVLSVDSFRDMLEREGYRVEYVVPLDRASKQGPRSLTVSEADDLFESIRKSEAFAVMAASAAAGGTDVVERARLIFREELARCADESGRVQEEDTIYVYVARRTI